MTPCTPPIDQTEWRAALAMDPARPLALPCPSAPLTPIRLVSGILADPLVPERLVPAGASLAQMLDDAGIARPLWPQLVVTLSRTGAPAGDTAATPIPLEHWHRVRPRPGTIVVVRVRLAGGGGKGGILRAVLSLAVLAVSAWAAGPVAIALGFTATGSAASAIGLGISLVGNLLVNALIPPPRQTLAAAADGGSRMLSGASNQLAPFGVVPRVYGRHKMVPLLAAQPLIETDEDGDQTMRLLFDYGYGPLAIDDRKIGETALGQYEAVETAFVASNTPADVLRLFGVITDNDIEAAVLEQDQPVTRTTGPADEILVDIAFPAGLARFDDEGTPRTTDVRFRIEYRIAASADEWISTDYPLEGATTSPTVRSTRIVLDTRGAYDVRITRLDPDGGTKRVRDSALQAIRTLRYQTPVRATGRSLEAMRIKATDQLNGVVSDYNVIATSRLRTWDGTTWTAAIETSHPAWIIADILRGRANARPVPDDQIDLDALRAWADQEPDWACNLVVDYPTTVLQLAQDVASCGRARFVCIDGRYTIIRETQRGPVQLFTPRNVISLTGRRLIGQTPLALRVRFTDESNDAFVQRERLVTDVGVAAEDVTQADIETLELPGTTDPTLAWRLARYHLAVGRVRRSIWELVAPLDHLVCNVGDVVLVSHSLLGLSGHAARAWSVATAGTTLQVVLDTPLPPDLRTAPSLRLRWRLADGTLGGPVAVTGLTDYQGLPVLSAALAVGTAIPAAGDLFSVEDTTESPPDLRLLVTHIRHASGLTATLQLTEWGRAEILAALDEDPPPYDPIGVPPAAPGKVRDLTLVYVPAIDDRPAQVKALWKPPAGSPAPVGYEVRQQLGARWERVGRPESPGFVVDAAAEPGSTITIKVRAIGSEGLMLPLAQLTVATLVVPA